MQATEAREVSGRSARRAELVRLCSPRSGRIGENSKTEKFAEVKIMKVDDLPEALRRIAAELVQIQWTMVKTVVPILVASTAAASAAMHDLAAAIREVSAEAEEAEEDPDPADETTAYAWPYGGYSPNLTSCELCGWLTCRCEAQDAELDAIANP